MLNSILKNIGSKQLEKKYPKLRNVFPKNVFPVIEMILQGTVLEVPIKKILKLKPFYIR